MNKILKRAGFVFLPVIILLIALFLYQEQVSYYILKNIAQFYAGREHIHLSVGRISGSPFSVTNFSAITVRPADGQPQTYQFKAQTIRCSYNLWDLRQGFEPFVQGLQCTAENPEFSYDLRVAAEQDKSEGAAGQIFVPAVLPGISLRNGRVVLRNSGWNIECMNVNSTLQTAAVGAHELQLQVGNFQFIQDDAARIATGFTAVLRYVDERLVIDSLVVGEQDIAATGFIDLEKLDKGIGGFAADLAFGESQLHVSGTVNNKVFQVRAGSDNFNIRELQERLGGTGWDMSGRIRGTIDLAYGLESKKDVTGSFALALEDGKMRGVKMDAVSLVGSLDAGILHVSLAEARTPGNHVLVSDVAVPLPLLQAGDFLPILGQSRAQFKTDLNDIAILFQLFKVKEDALPEVVRPNSLALDGHLEKGMLYLDAGRAVTDESSLVIGMATIPIPSTIEALGSVPIALAARMESSNLQGFAGLFGNIPLSGEIGADIEVKGRLADPETAINFTGEYLHYRETQLGSLALRAEIRVSQQAIGKIQSLQFTATELTQANDAGTLALLSPVKGIWKPDSFSISGAFQADGQGEIVMGVRKNPGKETEGEISIRSLDSTGWLGNFIDNRYYFHDADLEAVITGFPENPQVQLSGDVEEVGGAGMPFPLAGSLALHYSPKGIEILRFSWKSHERNQFIVTGFLPYDPLAPEPFLEGGLTLDGHLDIPDLEDVAILLEPWEPGAGSVIADIEVTGSWNQARGRLQLKADGINPPAMLKQYLDSPMNLACDIAAQNGSIVLQTARLETTDYSVRAKGTWRHDLSFLAFLQNLAVEPKGEVTADATMELRNLNFLRRELPWLRRIEGDMQGNLHLSGPINDPALTGSFSMKDGEISHSFNFPSFSAVNLQGDFNAHAIFLHTMQAEAGGSPINLSGSIKKEGGAVEVNLDAAGKNVLLYRSPGMQMRGDVHLDVAGPLDHLAISGTTALTGGYYTRNIDFLSKIGSSATPVSEGVSSLFSFSDPPLKNAVFNIKITSIEPFRIRNNLIRGALRPELTLKGTGELPYLVGTIYIDPSRMLLPSGRLQVQSGLVRFLEGEPDRPRLDLLAQSKVLGYDINVVTRGPLDDPVITLSSSPALPNDELLLLLLTGQPPKEELVTPGTLGMGKGATNVMVYLGRDFLNKWLEDESGTSDESILDRFELDFGRGITKSGEQTIEGSFRISNLESGKRKIYYLTAEKDKYDAYNYGLRLVFRFE